LTFSIAVISKPDFWRKHDLASSKSSLYLPSAFRADAC